MIRTLLDFSDPQRPEGPRLRLAFGDPIKTLVARQPEQVRQVLDAVQLAAERGFWCVGYLRYEAASAFDAALVTHPADGPLAWFAIYDSALPWPDGGLNSTAYPKANLPVNVTWKNGMARSAFDDALAQLATDIADGAFYQVNFTAPMTGELSQANTPGSPAARALFQSLQRVQPGGYSLFLDTGEEQILSVSPELFFDWRDGQLLTRPMKGTAPRGTTPQDDAAQARALRNSDKERAENVMIVDLLRNDVSRIAQPHSVKVPRLFHTEALTTVWQMTSDVTAHTRTGCRLSDVFAALFPCGSVTGAPKVRAMQAIQSLEPEARGVYCGALGVVQPGGAATFNVPIRTVTQRGTSLRCGIGSGITAGSVPDNEWDEWLHKQAFVRRASTAFSLLETLRLEDGHWHWVEAHLARMEQAARHFDYPWADTAVNTALHTVAAAHGVGTFRVRLLLDARGGVQTEVFTLTPSPKHVRLVLAEAPLEQAHGEFVRFKTTHRPHYDIFAPVDAEIFDTVLWNSKHELTECTRGNIAMCLDGRWVTPPLASGLLNGVGRARALATGRICEAVVRLSDMPRVTEFAFLNSLRGWIAASLPVVHTPAIDPDHLTG